MTNPKPFIIQRNYKVCANIVCLDVQLEDLEPSLERDKNQVS